MQQPTRIEVNKDLVINELLNRVAQLEHERTVLLIAYQEQLALNQNQSKNQEE